MWSSASGSERSPSAVSRGNQVLSAAPSAWVAKYILSSLWLLHMIPILPAKAVTAQMSSSAVLLPCTGTANADPQMLSAVVEWITVILLLCSQAIHSLPVVSLAMVRASAVPEPIVAGKPERGTQVPAL